MLTFDSNLKVIGVLGVPDLGDENAIVRIRQDLDALQEGGVDALLIENLGDTVSTYADFKDVIAFFERALETIRVDVHTPFGVALLPYEYENAFRLARDFDADFVWFDTFVDPVIPNYTPKPVVVRPNPDVVVQHKTRMIFTEILPANFYSLLANRPMEISAEEALQKGADSVTVVRSGIYQEDILERIRNIVGQKYPLGITGGLNARNIANYAGRAQYAVVYGALRKDGEQEKPIIKTKVVELMSSVR